MICILAPSNLCLGILLSYRVSYRRNRDELEQFLDNYQVFFLVFSLVQKNLHTVHGTSGYAPIHRD